MCYEGYADYIFEKALADLVGAIEVPELAARAPVMHVGWGDDLNPDPSLNFQLNRWRAYGGPGWWDDVRPAQSKLGSYGAWIDTFLALGDRALAAGRPYHAGLHLRAAEFFMGSDDPRKRPTRERHLPLLRAACGVTEADRTWVPFGGGRLPAWRFPAEHPKGTFVVFGGYDTYIEEFFPWLCGLRDDGWSSVAFEGPGQGTPLEDSHLVMTPDWQGPVSAVLDACGLDDVTLIGISLGGCLVLRAAAEEPRVRRVVAWDALTDFYACLTTAFPPPVRSLANMATDAAARARLDRAIDGFRERSPYVDWGIRQGLHVLGCQTPSEMCARARDFHTRDASPRVAQDVLLFAGTEDHSVPFDQVWTQGSQLTAARSVSVRIFPRGENAQAHCQIGNQPLALGLIQAWTEERTRSRSSAVAE